MALLQIFKRRNLFESLREGSSRDLLEGYLQIADGRCLLPGWPHALQSGQLPRSLRVLGGVKFSGAKTRTFGPAAFHGPAVDGGLAADLPNLQGLSFSFDEPSVAGRGEPLPLLSSLSSVAACTYRKDAVTVSSESNFPHSFGLYISTGIRRSVLNDLVIIMILRSA